MYSQRRTSVVAVVVLLFVLTFTMCASAAKLRIFGGTGASGRAWSAVVEKFQKDTGIEVELLQFPYAELREKLLFELSTGSSSLDVVIVDDLIWLADLYKFMEPLEPFIEKTGYDLSQNLESMVNLFKWTDDNGDEHIYALPARVGGRALVYRKDLIPEPPRTFEELLEIAIDITKNNPGMYGYVASMSQHTDMVADYLPFLRGFGADVFSEDLTRPIFNSPEGLAATQFFVDLYQKYEVVPKGAVTYNHDGTILAMQQGLAAMTISYSPYIHEMNDPEKSPYAGNFAMAPYIPYAKDSGLETGVSTLSGWGFGISKFSHNKDLAWEFVQYVAKTETQLWLAIEHGNAPSAKAVFSNPEYLAIDPFAETVLEVYAHGAPRPAGNKWVQVEDVLAAEVSAALAGEKTAEQALQDAEQRVLRILR
jgi:multiple sugar transport system substrate-binding protein